MLSFTTTTSKAHSSDCRLQQRESLWRVSENRRRQHYPPRLKHSSKPHRSHHCSREVRNQEPSRLIASPVKSQTNPELQVCRSRREQGGKEQREKENKGKRRPPAPATAGEETSGSGNGRRGVLRLRQRLERRPPALATAGPEKGIWS
ncbi:hypothetical protein DY000_02018008 [Brassica cretica]|uniref:Uncharacterized protein n=1 Tax=Brassica cretica TaxID=69181 RepID=A0ABQ7D2K5_BRACR|nr:hypothetical protein DY000_02018008 [Brassica cretica]